MCHFSKMHQSWVWSAQHTKCRVGGWILQVLPLLQVKLPPCIIDKQVKLPWHHYLPQQPVCGAPLRPGLQGLGQRAGPGRNCLLKLTKMCLRGEGAGGDSQLIGSELDSDQTSWCKREGSLLKTKGDKLCACDKKPKQSATQPEGVWFCVRFHWKLSSASQEYEVARKMKWNGLLSFFRQPEKIKFSWILCNQMRCICETCFYLVD